jgi:hypothetical protein
MSPPPSQMLRAIPPGNIDVIFCTNCPSIHEHQINVKRKSLFKQLFNSFFPNRKNPFPGGTILAILKG